MNEEETMDFMLLLAVLADEGVRRIHIGFDGGGDSGDVMEPLYFDGLHKEIHPPIAKDRRMEIMEFCENKLLEQVGDWYNNDGGFGDIYIDVPEGDYTIESHIRYTKTDDYDYEGKLQDYFKEEDE